MSDDGKQNQTPQPQQQPTPPKEQPKEEPPVELPKPNQGETVTKGG